jgi:hypothetical protein
VAPITFIIRLRNLFADPQYSCPSFLALLQAFQSHESSDYRDQVYGLAGLVQKHEGDEFVVDYSLSAHDVFIRIAQHIIRSSGSLRLLHNVYEGRCRCNKKEHIALGLPSWVPNWTCHRRGGGLIRWEEHFKAGGTVPPKVDFSSDGYALIVSGVHFGIVWQIFHSPYGTIEEMGDKVSVIGSE